MREKEWDKCSDVLREDLRLTAEAELPWEMFRGSHFFVTGATGLIGSLFIRTLLAAEEQRKLGLHITALVRSPEKAEALFADMACRDSLSFVCADIRDTWTVEGPVDYILHAAAVTASGTMVKHPTDVIRCSLAGMEKVLELARTKEVRKMIYLSSMEMYGNVGGTPADETALGYLDLSQVRTCYPESKRMCECMANAWASEFGVPVCSARLAQTFGPGVLRGERRVFAQFAESVIRGRDIVLRTEGRSEGNYCYTRDAMTALLLMMALGKPGEAYNVANEETHMQIRAMAKLVAENVAGGRVCVRFDIPEKKETLGYAADVRLTLCADKLRALGWKPEVGLEEAYRRLIRDLQERNYFYEEAEQ